MKTLNKIFFELNIHKRMSRRLCWTLDNRILDSSLYLTVFRPRGFLLTRPNVRHRPRRWVPVIWIRRQDQVFNYSGGWSINTEFQNVFPKFIFLFSSRTFWQKSRQKKCNCFLYFLDLSPQLGRAPVIRTRIRKNVSDSIRKTRKSSTHENSRTVELYAV